MSKEEVKNEIVEEKKEEVKVEVTEEKKEKPKKKKLKFIIILAVLAIIVVGAIFIFKGDNPVSNIFSKDKVKIIKNEASKVTYENYDNGLISLKIPKGWKVEVAPVDYIHYSFKVYNPKDPNYQLIFAMKLEGFNKSEDARNWQKRYYPDVVFAKLPVVNPQTTEGFYKVWNEIAEYVNTNDVKSEYLPKMNEFNIIQNLGENIIGGDILRATYKNSKNELMQGLFTASVKDIGSYYVNSNVFNLFSAKIDVWPLNVYNIVLMYTPDEEFNNWQGILDKCLGSLEFSQEFINGFNNEETTIMNTIKTNQKIYNSISDSIMSSWEARNKSYDIMSQKQSDATLGYERVYDTDTGEIYKATNGFMDEYSGSKYKPITDDMYNMPTSGYIEKK